MSKSDDLISRQGAIEALHDEIVRRRISEDTNDDGALDEFDTEAILRGLPSAQPETANIIVGKSRNGMTMWYQCDNCNEPVDENDLYCRGCGRRFEHGSDRQTGGD